MDIRKMFIAVLVSLAILFGAILFGQILGGYYIYNLLVSDNLPAPNGSPNIVAPPKERIMVLRLDPITFYTIQVGIYSDINQAQQGVNKVVELGYKPFVSATPPYRVWVGCFSEMNTGRSLEQKFKGNGFEAFIGQGIINDRALRFPEGDQFIKDNLAPLLREYNLLLNNGLKMFRGPGVNEYNWDTWINMINKMERDIKQTVLLTDQIMAMKESREYNQGLEHIKTKAILFSNGLSKITDYQDETTIINSQSQLLELIGAYHNLIVSANHVLGTI